MFDRIRIMGLLYRYCEIVVSLKNVIAVNVIAVNVMAVNVISQM